MPIRVVNAKTLPAELTPQEAMDRELTRFPKSDTNENKLIYTTLFHQYTELVESGIESRLKNAVDGFDMQAFLVLLDSKKDELMSDVFDLLVSLGDFESFKEVMLAYKREMTEGGLGLEIKCRAMKICTEEQEDGEERPDLDLGLQISPVGPGPRAMKF